MSNDLVIYGAGPLAKLMHFYFTHDSDYRVVAFAVDAEFLPKTEPCELPLLPFEEVATSYPPDSAEMFVAIGYRRMRDRMLMFERAKARGYRLANYISSRAIRFPGLEIGQNNVAMAGVQFEPFVKVGDNNLFWSDTLVCHGVSVGNGNYIAAKCVLGGHSVIDDGCFLGNGAILINRLKVRRETHILAGTTLFRDTKEHHKYAGNPAREIGMHEEQGIVIERG